MTPSFTVREATTADVSLIVHHRRSMFRDMGHTDAAVLEPMCRDFQVWVTERMEQGLYRTWLALAEDGAVASGAGLWLMDWPPHVIGLGSRYRGNILNVYTEPLYRRHGLARHLTAIARDWCWANGVPVVILHASDDGRSLYDAMGFKPTNEMRVIKPT